MKHKGRTRVRFGDEHEAVIRLRVENVEPGVYVATSPDVPGLVAEGRSVSEAATIAQDLARKIVESFLDHGDPLPRVFFKLKHKAMDLLVPVGVR
jgi:antitoxin HicB